MDTAVYLFTGFLEAGKTKFIRETMQDPNFNDGTHKYLVISCEEGEEELSPEDFGDNVAFCHFDSEEELNPDRLLARQKRYSADVIVIEYNGMWMLDKLYNSLPEQWMVYQEIMIMDSTTALLYNQNMRQLVVDKLTSAEMVVFNRVKADTDLVPLHKLVRGVSRKASICYEDTTGNIEFDKIEDPLPYDINAPVIKIEDDDFAVFFRDVSEEFQKYKGKTVCFKGLVAKDGKLPADQFAVGRHIMTCCADDIAYLGFVAIGKTKMKLKTRDWVIVEGVVDEDVSPAYGGGVGPIIRLGRVEPATQPKVEVATFN